MANRYWVGGSGNINQTSHWSTSSGGAGGASIPTNVDNVIFDTNSFPGDGHTVTVPAGYGFFSGVFTSNTGTDDWTLHVSNTAFFAFTRDFTLQSTMTLTCAGDGYFAPYCDSAVNVTWNGAKLKAPFVFQEMNPGTTTYILQGDIDSGITNREGRIQFLEAVFDANGHDITTYFMQFSGGSADFSGSTITARSYVFSNLSYNLINPPDVLNLKPVDGANAVEDSVVFSGGNNSYPEINILNTPITPPALYMFDNPTITDISVPVGVNIVFQSGTTTTFVNNPDISGSSGNVRAIRASTTGTRFTLKKNGADAELDYLDVKDSAITGSVRWFAGTHSVDSGNNTLGPTTTGGWYFRELFYAGDIELTGSSSMTSAPHITFYMLEALFGTSEVEALGRSLADQRAVEKSYLYKVYDKDDNYLGIWDDVIDDLEYSQELYSAGAAISVELARNSDTKIVELENLHTESTAEDLTTEDGDSLVIGFEAASAIGPGTIVDYNHRVEVWVFYGEVTDLVTESGELLTTEDNESLSVEIGSIGGRRKFNGFITALNTRYGSTETVRVAISSFGADLDQYVLEDAGDTTVTYSSDDPSDIVRDALDRFNAEGGVVTYDSNSVETTSTTVSYTFRVNTFLEVLRKAIELAPFDWYWYVDVGDDLVYFKDKPTEVSHTFVLGKHIEGLDLESSIEDITNVVYFTGGETAGVNLFKKYTDATSISTYRRGLKRISDHRVTLDASADLISEAEIERNSVPRYKTSLVILDSVYDIETIRLGQLVTFRNFGNYIDELELQIVGLSYTPDKVTLQLDTLYPSVNKRVEDLRRNLVELDNVNTPVAPT